MTMQLLQPGELSTMLPTLPRLHVLVVDDEFLMRWSLVETLTARGFLVTEADDAHGAYCAIRSSGARFDVVLLDYRLPDNADLSLLAAIRALTPDAPVILMTAFGTREVREDAMRLGAFRVVNKPFEMDDVSDLVFEAFAARITRGGRS